MGKPLVLITGLVYARESLFPYLCPLAFLQFYDWERKGKVNPKEFPMAQSQGFERLEGRYGKRGTKQ